MDSILYYRAMEAFSRQHAKMEGESEIFWLAEAEVLSKLGADAHNLEMLLQNAKKPREGEGVSNYLSLPSDLQGLR